MSGNDQGGERGTHRRPVEDFLGPPPPAEEWRWLWAEDRPLPVRSHRRLWGWLVVLFKRLLRPFVKAPQADLWDRQRLFNLALLDRLAGFEDRFADLRGHIERTAGQALRHNDALYADVDQKLDRYRRETRRLQTVLEAAGEEAPGGVAEVVRGLAYAELERRFRGGPEEIRERIRAYLPRLEGLGRGAPVVDLGCGRGEGLEALAEAGLLPLGVDSCAEMVERCRELGFEAVVEDASAFLAAREPGSLAGILCLHLVEHLEPARLERLLPLAARTLRPGGILVIETPNTLSLMVSARSFWLDPTHVRPLHPATLRLWVEEAGLELVEERFLRPFADSERLPEIRLDGLEGPSRELADRVNRLRDRLDEILFAAQDYALIATRPAGPAPSP